MNTPLTIAGFSSAIIHIIVFLILWFSFSPAPTNKRHSKIAVKTICLKPKEIHKPAAIPTMQPKVAPKEQAKKVVKPSKEIAKKGTPTKPKIVKEIKNEKEQKPIEPNSNLFAQAQASLQKIEKMPKKSAIVSTAIPTIHLESEVVLQNDALQSIEDNYREELASTLKLLLRLPEKGSLNVKLTIAKNGEIKKLEILSSESTHNQKYIESNLLKHTMPPLGTQFGNVDSYTFTITMKGAY